MPWKTVETMQERMKFITMVEDESASFAEACRRFGISRKTGYKWWERYNALGPAGLEAGSSVALHNGQSLSDTQVDAVVSLRREHPTWGPKKLRARLEALGASEALPAVSTIGAVLKRHGLVRPRRRRTHAPRELTGLTVGERPNDVWCVDFKGDFLLGDKTRCYPLTITDFESRYLLACVALRSTSDGPAQEVFEQTFREFGLPEFIRSDNGVPFASAGIGSLTGVSIAWIKQGIAPERTEPASPQQNGRHERMHRTLKAEATHPPAHDLIAQQRVFDRFRHEYNDVRPHEALGQRTPASRYALSSRTLKEPTTPSYHAMQTRRLDERGRLAFLGGATLLTKQLALEAVGLEEVADGVHDVYFGPLRLGALRRVGSKPVFEPGALRPQRAPIVL
jgi:putative transposase